MTEVPNLTLKPTEPRRGSTDRLFCLQGFWRVMPEMPNWLRERARALALMLP